MYYRQESSIEDFLTIIEHYTTRQKMREVFLNA